MQYFDLVVNLLCGNVVLVLGILATFLPRLECFVPEYSLGFLHQSV